MTDKQISKCSLLSNVIGVNCNKESDTLMVHILGEFEKGSIVCSNLIGR